MSVDAAEFCALLLPKSHVLAALEALNGCDPCWGNLLAKTAAKRGQACDKGVYQVDYRDSSEGALRAIELPPPLDRKMKHLLESLEGGAKDEPLRWLLEVARLEPSFKPPDPESLHPCPSAVSKNSTPPMNGQDETNFLSDPVKVLAALPEAEPDGSGVTAHAEVPTAKRWQRREVKSVSPVAPVAPVPSVKHSSMDGYRPSSMEPADPDRGSDPLPQKAPKHKPSDKCPICLEGFSAPGDMPRTCRKCNNNFHQACLSEWAKKEQQIKWEQKPWMLPSQFESGTCPCCRSAKGHDRSRRWKK